MWQSDLLGETYGTILNAWQDMRRTYHLPGRKTIMDALLASISLITIAEIGDKTQLLALILAARYRVFLPIISAIVISTSINHALSAWAGEALSGATDISYVHIGSSILFVVIGLWALKPDKTNSTPPWLERFGPFTATFIAFFIAEIGDKTQLATITLAAEYQSIIMVATGTTIGMLIANIPAVLMGEKLLAVLPLKWIRLAAALLFIGFGVVGLTQPSSSQPIPAAVE